MDLPFMFRFCLSSFWIDKNLFIYAFFFLFFPQQNMQEGIEISKAEVGLPPIFSPPSISLMCNYRGKDTSIYRKTFIYGCCWPCRSR